MSIKMLAIFLLIGHFGSVFFIGFVIKRQVELFRVPTMKNLKHFRLTLFYLSLAILIGNIVPITIDTLSLFINVGRPQHVHFASILYAMSNALIEFLSAYLVWKLYQLAADTKDITDYEATQFDKTN